MGIGDRGIAFRHIKTLISVGMIEGLTDAQLLERFASQRDETSELAFTALVERHGPMVFRVCRAVLRDAEDAQDAFQATFLVLARPGGLALGAGLVRALASKGRVSHRILRSVGRGAAQTP